MVIRWSPGGGRLARPPAVLAPRQTVGFSAPFASRRARARGLLTTELVVALAILVLAMIPLSYAVLRERQLGRALYYRAVASEIVDGEMEVLRAGAWRMFREGAQPYSPRAESAANLPPGEFLLTRDARRLRLEWIPEKRGKGGRVAREVTLP
jgi:hypothetical protein